MSSKLDQQQIIQNVHDETNICWSVEDTSTLKEYYEKGLSVTELSIILNKSSSAIRSKASKLGIKNTCKPLNSLTIDFIKNKIKQDKCTLSEIAKELKISKSALSAYCKRHKYNYKIDYTFFQINKSKRLRTKGESGLNNLFRTYKENARKRNYEFSLSKEEFKELTQQNCHYCSVEPKQIKANNSKDEWSTYIYNGIDRKNNSIGYTLDNCVSCCGNCNQMKMDSDYEVFLSKIELIFNHRIKR